MSAISNTGVLLDAIMKQDLKKCHAMSKIDVSREILWRYHFGALGQCPLHVAVLMAANSIDALSGEKRDRGVEMIEWLLQAGAELDVQNSLGGTPLKLALFNANVGIVSILISAGANISFEKNDSYGRSALHLACTSIRHFSNDCLRTVQYLIQKRVDVSHRDKVCS